MNAHRIANSITTLGLLLAFAGCEATVSSEPIGQQSADLLITSCTGPAISAAVTAGGSVLLNCGASPVTIPVPATTVSRPTVLVSTGAGRVTFSHVGNLFAVTGGASFAVDGIDFDGSTPGTGQAFRSIAPSPGSITIAGAVFRRYRNTFAILVGGGPASTLTIQNCTFDGNSSSGAGAPIYNEGATVVVSNSTFSNNSVTAGSGAAITSIGGSLTVTGTTFSNNEADVTGGAIQNNAGTGSATITNSTFFSNFAGQGGAAIMANGPTVISYTTFVDNHSPLGSISGAATVNASIIYDPVPNEAPCALAGTSNIQWPAVTSLCGSGFRFADPKIATLQNNGGPTQTCALGPGSAAIDSSTIGCPSPAIDQRSVPRPRDGDGNGSAVCDVGAFEL